MLKLIPKNILSTNSSLTAVEISLGWWGRQGHSGSSKIYKIRDFESFIQSFFGGSEKIFVGKTELSNQDSRLALVVPTVYIIRASLHIYGMFTGSRPAGQSQDCGPGWGWRGSTHSLLPTVTGDLPTGFCWCSGESEEQRGGQRQGSEKGETKRRNKPFHSQPLAFVFLPSHQINRKLAPGQ